MPNGSAAASSPDLPPELISDFNRFESAIQAARERGALLLPSGAMHQLISYGAFLHERSSALSLIAKGDRSQLFTRHVLDSLNPATVLKSGPTVGLDVGSGAGLPGIPLAIAWPGTRMTLVESRERKAAFMEGAIRVLRLRNVQVVCARLDEIGREVKVPPADCVLVRALGRLPDLLNQAKSAAQPGALWIYFLGRQSPDHLLSEWPAANRETASVAIGAFGGRLLIGSFAQV